MVKKLLIDVAVALKRLKNKKVYRKFHLSDLKIVFPYLKKNWEKALGASISMIVVSLLALPGPYLIKYIIDDVIENKNIRLLNFIILILISVLIIRAIVSFLVGYFFTILNQNIFALLKRDLFIKLLKMPMPFFHRSQSGYLVSRLGEVEGIKFFFSDSIARLLINSLTFVLCLCVLFYLNWKLTLFAISIIPIFYYITKFFSKRLRSINEYNLEKSAEVFKNMQEIISGIEVVKNFNAENREGNKVYRNIKGFYRGAKIRNIISSISTELIVMTSGLMGILILWGSGIEITKGTFTIGGYIAFSGYLAKLMGPVQNFSNLGLSLQPAIAALHRVSEINSLASEEDDATRKIKIKSFKGHIQFNNVSFNYPDRKRILNDVNFEILPGEKVAILGETGAGKSTIVQLLLGYYKSNKGKILIDNFDINQAVLLDLRKRIGIVSQNIFLFNDSIKNNILYSKPDSEEKDVIWAAKTAYAHNFITNMKNGYNTKIGEEGILLSGGQKQKIAIARTILKDCDIIIFDEATSQIDSKAETIIRKAIDIIFKEKTCIIIAHRTSLLNVDKTLYIENGRVFNLRNYSSIKSAPL